MRLPAHKTKIVCTIGPASRSEAVLERLMLQGMNVARLNFAHGTLQGHKEDIRRIRDGGVKASASLPDYGGSSRSQDTNRETPG